MAMVFNHDFPRKGFNTGDNIDYVCINALRDNKELGDERYNFVTIRKKGDSEYKKAIEVEDGDTFTLKIYFHNNANTSLGDKGIAKNTTISYTSGVFTSFEDAWEKYNRDCDGFMAYINSSNAEPTQIQDFCVIKLKEANHYKYINGTTKITDKTGTRTIPDSGYSRLELGDILAGESGYIELDFEVYYVDCFK